MGTKAKMNGEQLEANNEIEAVITKASAEGFEFSTVVKLEPGETLQGIYNGQTEGTITEDGESKDVLWVHVKTAAGVNARLLGAAQVITELTERANNGDEVMITRLPQEKKSRAGRTVHMYAVGVRKAAF